MPAFIDLSGQRFGKLTVSGLAPKTIGRLFWLCVCDCGNEARVSGDALKRSNTKSCGCGKIATQFDGGDICELTPGQRFGRWKVLSRAPNGLDRHVRWHCMCDCGKSRAVSGLALRAGGSLSCGCGVPRGEGHQASKLTFALAGEIRSKYAAGGVSQSGLAAEYGVCQRTINKVVNNIGWTVDRAA
jgi:hypothetical protein